MAVAARSSSRLRRAVRDESALPVAEESRSCIKHPALLFEAIQAAFSASLHVLIGRCYAVATATFAATLVATKFLMRRRVRSTNASLSALFFVHNGVGSEEWSEDGFVMKARS